MSESDGFVIVGGGLSASKAAEALREQGFSGPLTIVAEEPELPYERPALSKGYLTGSADRDSLFVHDHAWYADHRVEVRTGVRATALDRGRKAVTLSDGDELGYRKLLLATGARPRTLPLPGADAANVHYLRTVADCERLQQLFGSIQRLAIIGAGWIGLEVAAAARQAGVEVTVFEAAPLPLVNVLGPELAGVFAALHREHGVDFRLEAEVSELVLAGDEVNGIRLVDGTVLEADAVLVAVGAQPNVELGAAAGLAVDNGLMVGAGLITSDPDIVACGDVANAFHPFYNERIRSEHWATALKQPATAARSMLGEPASYEELPYFYSDQYDLGMEFLGRAEPGRYDQVLFRGDRAKGEYVAFWLDHGRVVAGMNVNVWGVTDAVKALIRKRIVIDPDLLTNPEIPLEQH